MANNRRRFRRIVLKTVMTATDIVTTKGEHIRKGYQLMLEDLSAGGLRYISRFALPAGTLLDLVFQLADRQVRARAEVVRSEKNASGRYDIGCRFSSINPVAREDIIRYVTLSSVRDAQPSKYYSRKADASPGREPLSCSDCRCRDCGDREVCRACYKPNCGKRFCRMYVASRQDLRRSL